MHYDIGPEAQEALENRVAIANIGAHEGIAGTAGDRLERVEISRVSQFVENVDLIVAILDEMSRHGGPDKTRAARYQHPHIKGS
jgi:Ni,Fe-hydrogenase III large subunit